MPVFVVDVYFSLFRKYLNAASPLASSGFEVQESFLLLGISETEERGTRSGCQFGGNLLLLSTFRSGHFIIIRSKHFLGTVQSDSPFRWFQFERAALGHQGHIAIIAHPDSGLVGSHKTQQQRILVVIHRP